jgi:hypothetical protein
LTTLADPDQLQGPPEPVDPAALADQAEPPVTIVTPDRRWPDWLPSALTIGVIVGVIAVTLWQLHINLLFTNTTTTGGDTGAHFVMPAFIRNHLLGSGRLTGWDPSWYDGYPIYTFYFVIPDLLGALASFVIPYGIAFKLLTVLGSLLLPVGAWACGRLFRLKSPGPAALAAMTLPFLFDYTWTIYGGNLFSTLAGEYAYSLAIPLALVFLGLFNRGLRTGKGRGWAAVVLALCILTHIVLGFMALAGAAVLILLELAGRWIRFDDVVVGDEGPGRRRAVWWGASTVVLGILLSSWWLVPFVLDNDYATQMGYLNITTFTTLFFPNADLWALGLAGVAVVVAVMTRSRFGILFAILGGLSALGLVIDPQGSLYNVRLLPLWFLCVYLLVGWLASVVVRFLVMVWRHRRDWIGAGASPPIVRQYRWAPAAIAGPLVVMIGALLVVIPPFVVSASALPVTPGANEVTNWSEWNYTGYEGKSAYPEFKALMSTMSNVGSKHGCGRAMWEYNADENRFGTPEALMDLAYFTGGCIDSMEGLLFESSTTTPYHFLNQAELSEAPSDPMVGLPYGPVDVPLGIEHLQLLGVRYFMAFSPQVVQEAKADPSLRLIASTGPWSSAYGAQVLSTTWDVFQVLQSSPVVALKNEPAVLTGLGQAQSSWLAPSIAWYDDPTRWNVELAADGPSAWPRVAPGQPAPAIPLPPNKVTGIVQTTDTISFHVSRLGAPVLVKTSYFPNWQASGASGPYRVAPNLMVVVPTAHTVTLTYGTSTAGKVGEIATVVGVVVLVGVFVMARRRRSKRPARRPKPEISSRPVDGN